MHGVLSFISLKTRKRLYTYILLYKEGIVWKALREASNICYLWERRAGDEDEKETSFPLYTFFLPFNFFSICTHSLFKI